MSARGEALWILGVTLVFLTLAALAAWSFLEVWAGL